jgi:NADH-ubiquinone oxidoreductase chain 2
MPKISILILLLELQTQIGLLGNISSIYFSTLQAGIELLNSITLSNLSMNNINEEIFNLENINSEINFEYLEKNSIYVLKLLLLISSLLSLIIGTVVGLAQTKIKRLLAYSTISHIGFILLALVINTEQSIDSFIFYIIQYSITNLNTFLIIIALGYIIQASFISISSVSSTSLHTHKDDLSSEIERKKYNYKLNNLQIETISDIRFISEFKNQFFSNPLLSLNLSVCLFSMAGVPPLIGFFAKQFVLYSAIQNGYYFISIIAILVSVISASYYLKIISVLYTEIPLNNQTISNNNKNISNSNILLNKEYKLNSLYIINKEEKYDYNNLNKNNIRLSNFHSFTISTLTLTILLFVLKPSVILNSTQLLALSLYPF